MIAGIFHEGSGLGDQLFRYITVRTLAEKKGYKWGMHHWNYFKGREFLDLDQSKHPTTTTPYGHFYFEKEVRDANGVDIRSFDPEFEFIKDDTEVDGSFEDDKYWRHNLDNISKWLAVEPLNVPDTKVVVGFRGGEYYSDSNLGLPFDFYLKALFEGVKQWHLSQDYEVHTEDSNLAKEFFSRFPAWNIVENEQISHSKHTNMGLNWRSARYAKYAIIPNSAFFILPRILKHHEDPTAVTIAPRYWARRNTKVWARPACYYPEFIYV